MATLNTRFILRSSNLFRNSINHRHDKVFAIDSLVENNVKSITQTSSGTPYEVASGADYYDAAATGDFANRVFVFIRNTSTVAGKKITIQFNNNGTRDAVMALNSGEFTYFPWVCDAATDKLEVFSNDSDGVKLEYILTPMK
jgi:hypothetical protein